MWCKLAFYSSSLNLQPVRVCCVCAHSPAWMCNLYVQMCETNIPTVESATFLLVSTSSLLMLHLAHKLTFWVQNYDSKVRNLYFVSLGWRNLLGFHRLSFWCLWETATRESTSGIREGQSGLCICNDCLPHIWSGVTVLKRELVILYTMCKMRAELVLD